MKLDSCEKKLTMISFLILLFSFCAGRFGAPMSTGMISALTLIAIEPLLAAVLRRVLRNRRQNRSVALFYTKAAIVLFAMTWLLTAALRLIFS